MAIKFDLYNNQGEGVDSTGLYTDGAAPTNVGSIDLTGTGIDLHSGDPINVGMTYDGTTLVVTETDAITHKSASQSHTIDIPITVGGGTAYVGFTAGTGGLTATQDILNWTYSPTATTIPAAPTNLTATAASGTQVNLTWTNNATNQTGFHIDRATDSAFTQNLVTQSVGASATSFVDGGLTAGATYYYRVRATNAAGDSANSNTANVTLPVPPAAPSNLQAVKITTSEVDLTWTNNATNATGIEVFRQKGANTFMVIANLPPTATSLDDTGLVIALTPGTQYSYDVEATNLAGPSGPASVTVTTLTVAPTNLTATAGNGQVNLTWTAPAGAVTYNIYRSTTSGGEGATPIQTGVTGTSFTDTGLTNGATYYYEVSAVDPGGESARSAEASATPQQVTPPSAPTNLTATAGNTTITLHWTASPGATSYNIYRSLSGNGEGTTPYKTGVTGTSFMDTGLADGTTYFYKVTAVNSAGESAPSNEASATPLFVAHVHFTSDAAEVPPGYVADTGHIFAGRGNGFTYGWNQDNTANMRDRDSSLSPDELHDGLAHMQKPSNPNASWKIALPDGTYSVHVLSGDPTAIDSVYKINVNGVRVINGTPTAAQHWFDGTVTVTVTTGILNVTNARGSVNNKIDAIDITQELPGVHFVSGFTGAGGQLTLNGSAKHSGSNLELTDGNGNEAGSAFTTTKLDVAKFSTQFSFQLTNPNADGFTFVVQSAGANSVGGLGGGLGYQGIGHSVAVKFDLYNNSGEGINSTGLYVNGAAPTTPAIDLSGLLDLHSGDVFNVAMTYDGDTLNVTTTDARTGASATQSYTVNIVSILGGATGYIGFTGGTGGLTATQNIRSWTYDPTA